MGSQPTLFSAPQPPDLRERGIDLQLGSCDDEEFCRAAEGARLVIADPPWRYDTQTAGSSEATDHYEDLSTSDILRILNRLACARMALWITEPLLEDWMEATNNARREFEWRWGKSKTGGAWVKSGSADAWTKPGPDDSGHFGAGYHWAGCEEPVRVYTTTDHVTNRDVPMRNAWIEPVGLHSRKPVGWQVQMVKKWSDPGDLIVDPFAGLGSVAEAVMLAGEGRRYLGRELDPKRRDAALALLAQVRV